MFSLIQKILNRVRSFDQLYDRLEKIEASLKKYEGFIAENEALWQFLDEQKELEDTWTTCGTDIHDDLADVILKNMKPYGDA